MRSATATVACFLGALVLAGSPAPAQTAPAMKPSVVAAPTLAHFRHALAPYGRWIRSAAHGEVWVPLVVPKAWRPYADGLWAYTEVGWTFVPFQEWGWATAHYGRWVREASLGWVWIPGTEWAPAWVTWRYGDGYVGWAPRGPKGSGPSYYADPSLWLFVRGASFHGPLLPTHFLSTPRVRAMFRLTYSSEGRGARYEAGPPVAYVSRLVGAPVMRVPAEVVAPRWVEPGAYRPLLRLQRAFRAAIPVGGPRGEAGGNDPAPELRALRGSSVTGR
jgi:hypothetical protein